MAKSSQHKTKEKQNKTYAIYATKLFMKAFGKLSKIEQYRIQKIRMQLKNNPLAGKPLGYTFLREKKIAGKRVYYVIYENNKIVLFVGVGDKKMQKTQIIQLKTMLEEYKKEIERDAYQGSHF